MEEAKSYEQRTRQVAAQAKEIILSQPLEVKVDLERHHKIIDHALTALRHAVHTGQATSECAEAGVEGVFMSDGLIPVELKQALLEHTVALETAPPDWHPDSNEQVLDLVHPSLYCYKRDLLLPIPGPSGLVPVELPPELVAFMNSAPSARQVRETEESEFEVPLHSWLPTDVVVYPNGDIEFLSYIANLHPIQHKALYGVLEQILARFIPLWTKTLRTAVELPDRPHRVNVDSSEWYDEKEIEPIKQRLLAEGKFVREECEDDDEFADRLHDTAYEEWCEIRRPVQPPVPKFEPRTSDCLGEIVKKGTQFLGYGAYGREFEGIRQLVNIAKKGQVAQTLDLRGRHLQVIVKLGNIVLTPEKPEFKGGSWHVEGIPDEHIVASGIYYYFSENITESRLAFRCAIDEPDYEQNDSKGVLDIYGLEDTVELNQDLGSVNTLPDRCIAFSNFFQHCVQPFRLIDESKPGVRKILVFFLVDPSVRIPSTLSEGVRRWDWVFNELDAAWPHMPSVLRRIICGYLGLMTHEEAIQARLQLMKERKFFIKRNTEEVFTRPFSLCEH